MAASQGPKQRAKALLDAVVCIQALAASAAAYFCLSLSRHLAARMADVIFDGIYRLANSPLEAGLLTLLALWCISWWVDRHTRAAQLLSPLPLRLVGALILQSAQRRAAADHNAAAAAKQRKGGVGAATASPASPSGKGSGKEIASFRLPDHSMASGGGSAPRKGAARRRAASPSSASPSPASSSSLSPGREPRQQQQQQRVRWSMDTPGSAQHTRSRQHAVRTQPKPRTSVDFDPAPPSPARRSPRGQHPHAEPRRRRGSSLADHRAAPHIASARRSEEGSQQGGDSPRQADASGQGSGGRWAPRMQRIASGQELAELAAGGDHSARSSLDAGSTPRAPAAAVPAAAPAEASGADAASAALSAWLPSLASLTSLPSLSWPGSPTSASEAAAGEAGSQEGGLEGSPTTSLVPASPASAPAASAAAAVARCVAASGSAAAAWASSTVDTVLRPLIPGGVAGAGGEGASAPPSPFSPPQLWRSLSAAAFRGAGADSDSDSAPQAVQLCAARQLHHSASAPLSLDVAAAASAAADSSGAAGQAQLDAPSPSGGSASEHRRQSLDGKSARHYSHGGVAADPARKPVLESLACAARMQLCAARACTSAGLAAAASSPAPPGGAALAEGVAGPAAATSALASVGLDGDCPQDIRAHVTDEHLIQFAALAGEEAAAAAAAQLCLPPAWADGASLLSAADGSWSPGCSEERWEQVMERSAPGLTYEVWRQELRKGLFMYRSRAVFQGVAPADLRPFHLDDTARFLWDENVIDIRRLLPPSQAGGRLHKHSEWCLHQYRSRFPRPLAAREYQYARRVWHRPSDGGCYVVCRGMPLPDAGDGYRSVKVTDIVSASIIRALAPSLSEGGPASEMVSLYFEDSGVRPGLAKMAVKGMWSYMQNYDAALRVFAEARRAAAAEYAAAAGTAAPPRRRPSLDRSSADGQQRRRRRQLLPQLAEAGEGAGEDGCGSASEDDAGSSSGDDALSSTYAAMARRLHRGPGRRGSSSARARWAGRLVVLAGIKMVHTMLSVRR